MTSRDYYADLEKRIVVFQKLYNQPAKDTCKLDDIVKLSYLGKGAFGTVYLVQHKSTKAFYALKCLSKEQVVANGQVDGAINEKKMLASVNSEFIIKLSFSFKDNANLYMVIDFICGGEIFELLRSLKMFNEAMVRFYSSQVILVFEYLHRMHVAYRDLKPENILLNADGYIKVADLGFAKRIPQGHHMWTVCGTPDYMAPEIILRKGYHVYVDWWAFGVLLFEFTAGYPPFMTGETMKTFERIIAGKYKFTSNFSKNLQHLVMHLIQSDLTCRYGNLKNGINDLKEHPFYSGLDWDKIYNKGIQPPHKPPCTDMTVLIKKLKSPDTQIMPISTSMKFEQEFKDF